MHGKGKNVLLVAESQTAGGVVTVLNGLLTEWSKDRRTNLLLLYNRVHGGAEKFRDTAAGKKNISENIIPLWDYPSFIEASGSVRALQLFLKIAVKIIYPLIFIRRTWYFYSYCRKNQVDVLFSHNGGYPGGILNRAAVVGAKLASVPKIYMVVHNLAAAPPSYRKLTNYISDRLVSWATDRLLVVSNAVRESLLQNRCLTGDIAVLYNAIDTELDVSDEKPSWGDEENRIVYIGELAERKGLAVLFRALAEIEIPYKLVIFGKGNDSYIRSLHALADELGISDNILFSGYDPDAGRKIIWADLLVLPSLAYESFGMVLLEAMRCKKPVIVSDTGGMKEVVVHNRTGLVVRAGDVSHLKGAIKRLMTDRELSSRLGEEGYKRLLEEFSLGKMTARYKNLVDKDN